MEVKIQRSITWNTDTCRFPPLRDGCIGFLLTRCNDLLDFQNCNRPHLLPSKNDTQKAVVLSFEFKHLLESFHLSFREWQTYFKDPYNYFDWLGLILTFLVIPLRFVGVDSQWSVAALGYLFNFLRLFKFSCFTRYYYA